MTSIVTPTRKTDNKGEIKVEAEGNAMVLMDHGNGVISHVQCGFNYFDPYGKRICCSQNLNGPWYNFSAEQGCSFVVTFQTDASPDAVRCECERKAPKQTLTGNLA